MYNNTFEDYKKAVKTKYEKEKEGNNFELLETPSQAKLRDLCWEKFEGITNQEDLTVFSSFFGFQFDPTKKKLFNTQKDKLKPITNFFKGNSSPTNIDTVNLAAILIDYKPRPYHKFRTKGILLEEEKNTVIEIQPEDFLENKPKTANAAEKVLIETKPLLFETKPLHKQPKNFKLIIISLVLALGFGFSIYQFLTRKQCMQWSNDHYEIVACDLKTNNIAGFATIEPINERKLELKKIKICDTTTFFKKGIAIIWYAKTEKGIDFFNTHGFHPESNKPLKPITQYIIDKYVR